MPQDIRVLAARRVYDFRPDDLRFALLGTSALRTRIQGRFGFQQTLLGAAVPTLGAIDISGQGLTFTSGSFSDSPDQIIPIRFLQLEPTRIVIDVAAPSGSIDRIFAAMQAILSDVSAPDGSPVIGKAVRESDYSEVSVHLAISMNSLFAGQVPPLFADLVGPAQELAIVVAVQALMPNDSYPGFPPQDAPVLRFAPRQGFSLNDRVYFSAAPVNSDQHLAYLAKLEAALKPQPKPRTRTQTAR